MEYKAERASVPTRFTLVMLCKSYHKLEDNLKKPNENHKDFVVGLLEIARDKDTDLNEINDIESVYYLLDQPKNAMARIADILTCNGRIYDEYSEFLKPKEENEIENKAF